MNNDIKEIDSTKEVDSNIDTITKYINNRLLSLNQLSIDLQQKQSQLKTRLIMTKSSNDESFISNQLNTNMIQLMHLAGQLIELKLLMKHLKIKR